MKLRKSEWSVVELHSRNRVNEFLNKYHYLGALPVWKIALGLFSAEDCLRMYEVIVLGLPVSRILMQKEPNTLEVRRLCLSDEAPKNAASYLLGYATRWGVKHGYDRIVSYADPSVRDIRNCPANERRGTIYFAANFRLVGWTKACHWKRNGRDRRIRYTGPKLKFIWDAKKGVKR